MARNACPHTASCVIAVGPADRGRRENGRASGKTGMGRVSNAEIRVFSLADSPIDERILPIRWISAVNSSGHEIDQEPS